MTEKYSPCYHCGNELDSSPIYHTRFEDSIADGFLYCPACIDLDLISDPPMTPEQWEQWDDAMTKNCQAIKTAISQRSATRCAVEEFPPVSSSVAVPLVTIGKMKVSFLAQRGIKSWFTVAIKPIIDLFTSLIRWENP